MRCFSCWHSRQNRYSFCSKTSNLSTLLPPEFDHHQTINPFSFPSWLLNTPHKEQIFNFALGIASRGDEDDLNRWCSIKLIASYQASYTIHSNGSSSGGTRNRGAAAVVIKGFQPKVLTSIKTKGRMFTSPYEEKATAMEPALTWTSTNNNHPLITILFCTDSISLSEAVISSNPRTSSIHNSINFTSSSIFIQ